MRISDWSSDVCSSDLPVIGDIPGTTVDLNRLVGNTPHHFTRKHLAAGRLCGDVGARIFPARSLLDHATGCKGFRLHVSEHGLDELELGNRLAELLAFHRITQTV